MDLSAIPKKRVLWLVHVHVHGGVCTLNVHVHVHAFHVVVEVDDSKQPDRAGYDNGFRDTR